MQISRVSVWLLLATFPVLSFGAADERCLSAASSELERLYCEVVAQGGGAGLPAQPDFNRNNPKVQALLLKRPAQKLGLSLPEPEPEPDPESKNTESPEAAEPAPKTTEPPEPNIAPGLKNCRLDGEQIRCPYGRYQLASNQPLAELADGVLGPDNRLQIAPFTGNRSNETAVRPYLSKAYDQYIPKMLKIGLGANTMSFTAFHNAFHTLESGGVTFSDRMAETYELLKQDRRQLGVKRRYHDELPENLSLCGAINRDILVCDNVGTNWVFVRSD